MLTTEERKIAEELELGADVEPGPLSVQMVKTYGMKPRTALKITKRVASAMLALAVGL